MKKQTESVQWLFTKPGTATSPLAFLMSLEETSPAESFVHLLIAAFFVQPDTDSR
jgi:hypothetical protein